MKFYVETFGCKVNTYESSYMKKSMQDGGFFYVDNNINKKVVEELSLTRHNLDTEGFISAGETLAIAIDDEFDVEKIVIDIEGDRSIKECDKLTEMFLGDNSKENYKFPLTIYPNEDGIFRYVIPYGTKQSLESWATLRKKSNDYEGLNKDLLFTRREDPYKLIIYINGDEENVIFFYFDVFVETGSLSMDILGKKKYNKIKNLGLFPTFHRLMSRNMKNMFVCAHRRKRTQWRI